MIDNRPITDDEGKTNNKDIREDEGYEEHKQLNYLLLSSCIHTFHEHLDLYSRFLLSKTSKSIHSTYPFDQASVVMFRLDNTDIKQDGSMCVYGNTSIG